MTAHDRLLTSLSPSLVIHPRCVFRDNTPDALNTDNANPAEEARSGDWRDVLNHLHSRASAEGPGAIRDCIVRVANASDTPSPDHGGDSWATAYSSVQRGIDAARVKHLNIPACGTQKDGAPCVGEGCGHAEVWLAQGVWIPDSTDASDERRASFTLAAGVRVYGGFAGSEESRNERDWASRPTVLSGDVQGDGHRGNNAYHVVVGANESRLDGVVVTLGYAISGDSATDDDDALTLSLSSNGGDDDDDDATANAEARGSSSSSASASSSTSDGSISYSDADLSRFTTAAVAAAAGADAFHAARALRGPGGGQEDDVADDSMFGSTLGQSQHGASVAAKGNGRTTSSGGGGANATHGSSGGGGASANNASSATASGGDEGDDGDDDSGASSHATASDELDSDTSTVGGGLLSYLITSITIANVVFYDNYALKGGAAYNINDAAGSGSDDGESRARASQGPAFENVGFVANYAADRGGAIANDVYTFMSCSDCMLVGNACAGKGGGVYNDYSSSPYFERSTFVGNYALDGGGALGSDGSSEVELVDSDVIGNSARDLGGGLYLGTYGAVHAREPNSPRLTNTRVRDNTCEWNGPKNAFLWGLDEMIVVNSTIGGTHFEGEHTLGRR